MRYMCVCTYVHVCGRGVIETMLLLGNFCMMKHYLVCLVHHLDHMEFFYAPFGDRDNYWQHTGMTKVRPEPTIQTKLPIIVFQTFLKMPLLLSKEQLIILAYTCKNTSVIVILQHQWYLYMYVVTERGLLLITERICLNNYVVTIHFWLHRISWPIQYWRWSCGTSCTMAIWSAFNVVSLILPSSSFKIQW